MNKLLIALFVALFGASFVASTAEAQPRNQSGYSQQKVKKPNVRKKTKKRVKTAVNNRQRTQPPRVAANVQKPTQPPQVIAANHSNLDEDSPSVFWARERERQQQQQITASAFGSSNSQNSTRTARNSRNRTSVPEAQPVVFWNNNNTQHIQRAESMLGLSARRNRTELKQTFARTLGHSIDPVRIPWCAAWANAVLADAGIQGTGSLMARSFTNWGKPTAAPKKGDVVVLRRGRSSTTGHVGFFYGFVDHNGVKKVALLGGNQGKQVAISYYPISKVIAYRTVG